MQLKLFMLFVLPVNFYLDIKIKYFLSVLIGIVSIFGNEIIIKEEKINMKK